jgi:ribosome-binding protein aMBF1 (putative translation factor)
MRQKYFSPKSAKSKKVVRSMKAKPTRSESQEKAGRGIRKINQSELYDLFQQLLIEARKKSGLSQQEVADRLGRPQTYVSKCERGTRRMDVVEFLEMAYVIDVDPVAFVKKLALAL